MEPDAKVSQGTYSPDPDERPAAGGRERANVFVPALLLALAVVAWLAVQAVELVRDRQQQSLATASLEAQEQAARKLRASLDALATAMAKLAAEGNANAGAMVEELRRRGITIRSPGTP